MTVFQSGSISSAQIQEICYIFFGNIMILYNLWNFGKGNVVQYLNLHKIIICS